MILQWHLLFKIIIQICKRVFEFCGKPSVFVTKSCVLIFCTFCLTENELIQQSHLRNYIENEIFYYTLTKNKKQNKMSKTIIQLSKHHFWNSWKTITNCSWFLHLFTTFCSDVDETFKNKNWCKNVIGVKSCYH